jgi:hypothetical protein
MIEFSPMKQYEPKANAIAFLEPALLRSPLIIAFL